MSIDALIMLSGILVALVPFLGFPLKIDNIMLVIIGVLVIALGIIVRRRGLKLPSAVQKARSTFVESPLRAEAHE